MFEELHSHHTELDGLFSAPLYSIGWPLVVVNVFFFGYICWLGFWFTRGTERRQRFFMVGWFAGVVLWPASDAYILNGLWQ